MTPEEELEKMKAKTKRDKKYLYYFVAGFIFAMALVGMTYMSSI